MLSKSFVLILPLLPLVLAVPVPNGGSAYTGTGGTASGGSVLDPQNGLINLNTLNLDSNDAGSGGSANSGSALGGGACNATSGGNGGNAYTGTGGTARGGDVTDPQTGLININALNLDSNNAGHGGSANSGDALGGSAEC